MSNHYHSIIDIPRQEKTMPPPVRFQTMAQVQEAHFLAAVEKYGKSATRLAKVIGIGRCTVYRWLKKYGD